jgi:hypothetical protein
MVVAWFGDSFSCDGGYGEVDRGTSGSSDNNNKHTTNFPIPVTTATQIHSQKAE